MRNVSACAWALGQSRLSAAAAAAELFSSCLREVGILSSLKTRLLIGLVIFLRSMGNREAESQQGESRGLSSADRNAIAKWAGMTLRNAFGHCSRRRAR